MIYPWQLSLSLTSYLVANGIRGKRSSPIVLMLEPTLRCNLACAGCGRIRQDKKILGRMLTAEECLAAADESGSPVVCLTGGEPLLHPQIAEIVAGMVAHRRFIFLATNGIKAVESLPLFKPSPHLSFVFHLDGLAATHDRIVERQGVFDTVIAAIKAAKKAGFQVRTNTTVYKGTDWRELYDLFTLLSSLGTDGIIAAPAFSYEEVKADIFPSRSEVAAIFAPIYEQRHHFRFYNTPLYLEFLAGRRTLQCKPWSTPARDPIGWKQPCYLIADGYCQSYEELRTRTAWERYGTGHDPRCANCMMHYGFEAGALEQLGKNWRDLAQVARWNLVGH
jgi:hopanoid biosynthesis associated radical SAM protein HpnH